MNANELAEWVEDDSVVDIMLTSQEHYRGLVATMLRQQQAEYYSLLVNHDKLYAKVIEQQAEIEALKNGFNTTWAGTNNSEMAEVRAMANRCILKIQELEFEQEGFENLVEMLESEKEELVEKTRQQQAEYYSLLVNHDKLYAKVVEQQAEIEALKAELRLIDELVTGKAQEK